MPELLSRTDGKEYAVNLNVLITEVAPFLYKRALVDCIDVNTITKAQIMEGLSKEETAELDRKSVV